MAESRRVKECRETLQELAKPRNARRRKELEGKAAKLGTALHDEESKGKPVAKPGSKPRDQRLGRASDWRPAQGGI
jgi:hypothetical protein